MGGYTHGGERDIILNIAFNRQCKTLYEGSGWETSRVWGGRHRRRLHRFLKEATPGDTDRGAAFDGSAWGG